MMSMEFPDVRHSGLSGPTAFAVLLLPALAVIAIWIPFGFSLGGLIEEWDFLFLFARKGVFYITSSTTLPSQTARPLHVLPQALAYTLDPDSFHYWHIIQAAALMLKAFCGAVIGLYLTKSRALAAFLGLLVLLYPADTMQLNFRSLSDNWATALALLATVLCIIALRAQSRPARLAISVLASGVLASALLMWEAVAGLAALPLLIVFAREGLGVIQIVRHRWSVCLIWVAGVLCWAAYFMSAVRAGSGYQVAVLSGVTFDMVPKLAAGLITSGAYRVFFDCWIALARIVFHDLSAVAYPLVCTLVLAVALLWLSRVTDPTEGNRRLALRTMVAGLAAFALGYAPLLASYSSLFITQRTFLTSAMGGALIVFGLIEYASAAVNPAIIASFCALLLGGCFVGQLYQFDQYSRIYASAYRPLLSAITPFIQASSDHAYTVIRNDYGYLSGVYDLGLELRRAIGYLFPNADVSKIFVCEGRSARVLPRWRGETERTYCKIDRNSVAITKSGAPVNLLDRAAIGVLRMNGDISTDEDAGLKHAPVPDRVARLLSMPEWTPKNSLFRRTDQEDRYECRFEYMWGYAVPCRLFGFFETEPLVNTRGASYAWIGEVESGLIFDIKPSHATYNLLIEVVDSHSPMMQASLNGTALPGSWQDAKHFEASFPANLLRQRNNVLELRTEPDQASGLSFAVTNVSIKPER